MTGKQKIWAAKAAVALGMIPALIHGFSGGPPPGRTGAPGEMTCASAGCHAGTAIPDSEQITLTTPDGNQYSPGVQQRWTVQVSRPEAAVYGFQLSVRDASVDQAGTLAAVDATTSVATSGAGIQYVRQTMPRVDGVFEFDWTPPPTDIGPLTVYVAANAANGNFAPSGDQILLRNFAVTPAPVGGPNPTLSEGTPIVNAASFQPGIAAGGWIAIFGTDLAPTTRMWDPATEIINGDLPTELDGVSVQVNGKAAAVSFISPLQVNVQAPDDQSEGPVQVELTRDGVTAAPAIAQLQKHAPGFFLVDPGGRRYVAAVHFDPTEDRVEYVGPDGLFGDEPRAKPAKAGDMVMLFGTGFGPTDPPVPSGRLFEGAAALADPVTIRFGDVVADDVSFAGISGAGLYQFNVRIPNGLPEGDVPLTAEIGGLSTQDGVFIRVDP